MDNTSSFYKFIDETIFSDVITNIITIAALKEFDIDIINLNLKSWDIGIWKLYLYKLNINYTIIFCYNNYGHIYHHRLRSCYEKDKDIQEQDTFKIILQKVLEEV